MQISTESRRPRDVYDERLASMSNSTACRPMVQGVEREMAGMAGSLLVLCRRRYATTQDRARDKSTLKKAVARSPRSKSGLCAANEWEPEMKAQSLFEEICEACWTTMSAKRGDKARLMGWQARMLLVPWMRIGCVAAAQRPGQQCLRLEGKRCSHEECESDDGSIRGRKAIDWLSYGVGVPAPPPSATLWYLEEPASAFAESLQRVSAEYVPS